MTSFRRLVVEGSISSLLVVLAFGGGWWASGLYHGHLRTFTAIHGLKNVRVPAGFEVAFLPSQPQFDAFRRGDWVDLLVLVEGEPTPVALNAILISDTDTAPEVAVVLPPGCPSRVIRRIVLDHGGFTVRRSIVPAAAGYEAAFLAGQELSPVKRAKG